jgi:hypothetical protein
LPLGGRAGTAFALALLRFQIPLWDLGYLFGLQEIARRGFVLPTALPLMVVTA